VKNRGQKKMNNDESQQTTFLSTESKSNKYSLSNQKNPSDYVDWDEKLMKKSFSDFCRKYQVNYDYAQKMGIENAFDLLVRYKYDRLDQNMKKEDCENLYRLIKDPWGCSKLDRHFIMAQLIQKIIFDKNKKINRILIVGAGIGGEFQQMSRFIPDANYVITDISQAALDSFKERFHEKRNYTLLVLDIFNRNALEDFVSNNGTFDLVIASGVYRYAPNNEIQKYSAKYIYDSFLNAKGLLSITEVRQNTDSDNPILLDITPCINTQIKTKTRINPTHFVVYEKQ